MKKLMMDLETKSDIDIAKSGVYRYADSPYFDILLFAYSVDDTPVQVVDLACGEQLPEEILNALTDDRIQKHAFNASFERVCLSVWLRRNYPERFVSYGSPEDACGNYLSPNAWRCTMVAAAYLGLPLSLAGVGAVLQLQQQKMSEGKALIRYFCVPYDTVNGIPVFHVPTDAPEKWNVFRAYNQRDVETEQAIERRLSRFPVPEFVWQEYALDQTVNDRGIQVDLQLVQQAIRMDALTKDKLLQRMKALTNLDNPNSVYQLLGWLETQGYSSDSLGKAQVQERIKTAKEPVRSVLELRLQLSKASVKKYQAMQNAVCSDGRARGMFQFYGANRTGREAGRIIQLQNLPQNHLPDLEAARELVKSGNLEAVELLYEDVPDTLSQLIRTAFVPKPGYKFLVADFSAIEARVIAWLAGETWRMQAFAEGKDIYCASASKIFGVPVVKHGENGHLRQKGKVAELACIAEGQLVETDHGLKPIEKVELSDRVWDGENWVRHEGVIFKGYREVINYEGLEATPDHMVFIEGKHRPVRFDYAAASGAHLKKSRAGGAASPITNTSAVKTRVYDIRNAGPHHRYAVSGKIVHNCGYGGGVGALTAMGALRMGVPEEELQPLVTAWRASSPHIVEFWWAVDRAVRKAIEGVPNSTHGLGFHRTGGFLFITLPSGRRLAYPKPSIRDNRIHYWGTAQAWCEVDSYGPKFVENIVQATSRDLLCNAMRQVGIVKIEMHIHDELVIEAEDDIQLEDICKKMAINPSWAEGLLLRADGYETPFYKKD